MAKKKQVGYKGRKIISEFEQDLNPIDLALGNIRNDVDEVYKEQGGKELIAAMAEKYGPQWLIELKTKFAQKEEEVNISKVTNEELQNYITGYIVNKIEDGSLTNVLNHLGWFRKTESKNKNGRGAKPSKKEATKK